MLLLTATTDKIQVITSAAVTVDVHASYMKHTLSTDNVEGARTNTAITTATTTDIVPVPTSGDTVNVKTIHIRNKHASTPTDVTVQYNQNGTLFELFKATLQAGDVLEYIEGVGFFVITPTGKLDTKLRVASDVVNATTSLADITGLTCPVEAGKHYNFEAHLYHQENASTTGAQFAINGPTMTAMRAHMMGIVIGSVSSATIQSNPADVTARDTVLVAATGSSTVTNVVLAIISGWINPSAAGTFAMRCASEVAVAAGITVKQGSWCRVWEADN